MTYREDAEIMISTILRRIRRKLNRLRVHVNDENKHFEELLSVPPVPVKNDNSYVIIVHGAQYGGAPLLGLDIAKEFCRQGRQVDILSLGYGPLIKDFAAVANVQVCINEKEAEAYIERLYNIGFHRAICNGALTGKCVPLLKKKGYSITALIHELPGVIQYFDAEKDIKQIINDSDSLIYPATFVKNQIERKYGVNQNTLVLHQGLANIAKNTLTKTEAKRMIAEKYGFNCELPLFINVATINERKGFDLFVEMAAIDHTAIYLWVGDGIDGRFGKKVTRKIGVTPDNLVLPGYINDMELLNTIYRAADILLLTSREEPFGTIVLEAFSRETPVVAFRGCGGYEDVVIPSKTGFLVPPFDLPEMIKDSHALVNNRDKLDKVRAECYTVASKSDFSEYCRVIAQQSISCSTYLE